MIWADYEILKGNDGWYWMMVWPGHPSDDTEYGPFITRTEAVQDAQKHVCGVCNTLNPKNRVVCVKCSAHFAPLRVPYNCPSQEALEILLLGAVKGEV